MKRLSTRVPRILGLLLLGAIIVHGNRMDASADAPQQQTVAVEIVPQSIEVAESDAARALLIFRNRTADSITSISVTPVTNTRMVIAADPPLGTARSVEPGGELAWNVKVSRGPDDPIDGAVILGIQYRQARGGSPAGLPLVTYATLQVKSRDVAELADVKIETTLDALDEQHPGKIYLVVTNKSAQPITVHDVVGSTPGFIRLDTAKVRQRIHDHPAEFIFPPHQTGVIEIGVDAASRVQPGKHLILFTVDLGWGKNASAGRRSIVVTRSIEVGVFGESVLIKILAIPSILLMPGVLILVTWGLLWKWGVLKWEKDVAEFPLEIGSQPLSIQFWVVSISLSILVVFLYMQFFNNVLVLYGLADLVWIWVFSVFVFGAGGYVAITGLRRWYLRRRTPKPGDSPVDILKKLDRRGLSIRLWQGEFKRTGIEKLCRLFLLEPIDEKMTTIWAAPPVELDWKTSAQPPEAGAAELKERIRKMLQREGDDDAAALAELLEQAEKAGIVTVSWGSRDDVSAPIEMNYDTLAEQRIQPTPIAQEKVD